MAVPAAAVLPAAFLEDDDLVQPVLCDHRRGHCGPGHGRRTQRDAGIAADREDIREGHGRAGLSRQLLDLQHRIRRHPVLFPAGADHCEHRTNSQTIADRQETRRPESGGYERAGSRCQRRGPYRAGDAADVSVIARSTIPNPLSTAMGNAASLPSQQETRFAFGVSFTIMAASISRGARPPRMAGTTPP